MRKIFFICLAALLAFAGLWMFLPRPVPVYTVGFINKTGTPFTGVRAHHEGFEAIPVRYFYKERKALWDPQEFGSVSGEVPSGSYAVHQEIKARPPDAIELEWLTPDGERHRKVVDFRRQTPSNLHGGVVYLTIGDGDSVVVNAFDGAACERNAHLSFLKANGMQP
jgi:hypothetical protein